MVVAEILTKVGRCTYLAFQSGGCHSERSDPGGEVRDKNSCWTAAVPLPDKTELCMWTSSTAGETSSGLSTTLLESLKTAEDPKTAKTVSEQNMELHILEQKSKFGPAYQLASYDTSQIYTKLLTRDM